MIKKKETHYTFAIICSLVVSVTLCSKAIVLTEYQNAGILGRILELAISQFGDNTILSIFLVISFTYAFSKIFSYINKFHYTSLIVPIIFAILYMVGKSFACNNSFAYIFGNGYQFLMSMFNFCGWSLYFWIIMECFVLLFKNKKQSYSFNLGHVFVQKMVRG